MKRLFIISIMGIILLLIEFILLLILNQIGYILDPNTNFPIFAIQTSTKYSMEVNLMRLIFYFPLWVACIYMISDKIKIKNIILKVALLNVLLYLLLSAIYSLIFPFSIEYFQRLFFYFLTISTFVSPFIMNIFLPKSYWESVK